MRGGSEKGIVAKLVLFLPDGTTLDVPLNKERITIGRRADNDVSLPHLAVSGEHAAIVTILADSFLEDLNSTNGTLVNGKAIAKHFLRDNDQIDVGRHKLVYCTEDDAVLDPDGHVEVERARLRNLGERVEPAKPFRRAKQAAAPAAVAPRASTGALGIAAAPREEPEPSAANVAALGTPPAGQSSEAAAPRAEASTAAPWFPQTQRDSGSPPQAEVASPLQTEAVSPPQAIAVSAPQTEAASSPADLPTPSVASLKVLSGPRAGRSIPLTKEQVTIGRPGIQVAAIVLANGLFRLKPLEGERTPAVNGQPVGGDGIDLAGGDVIEIAETRLEFVAPA
jgi:pSer/pThr/pTyr-binding forkhead associated (FHA) protein